MSRIAFLMPSHFQDIIAAFWSAKNEKIAFTRNTCDKQTV